MRLDDVNLEPLSLRLRVIAVLLERGAPMRMEEIAARLAELNAMPRGGRSSLKRAAKPVGGLLLDEDGRYSTAPEHARLRLDSNRIERAVTRSTMSTEEILDRVSRRRKPGETTAEARERRARHAVPQPASWRGDGCPREKPSQLESTWLGTRRPLEGVADGDDHLDLLLWLDVTLKEVRAFDALPRGQHPEGLAALFERAVHDPMQSVQPGMPRTVAIDVDMGRAELALTVQAHGAQLVDDADCTPLEEVFAMLRSEVAARAVDPNEISILALQRFLTAAEHYLLDEPFRGVTMQEALRIEGLSVTPLYVTLMDRPFPGLVIFLQEEEALRTLLKRRRPEQPSLMLRFHDPARVPGMTSLATKRGWREHLVPLPTHMEADKSRLVSGQELELLLDVLETLSHLQFETPFRDRDVRIDSDRTVRATWPLLASPFGQPH